MALKNHMVMEDDYAEKLATSISQEFPRHNFSRKILGAVFSATSRASEALIAYQTAVALSPGDAEAHIMAWVLRSKN